MPMNPRAQSLGCIICDVWGQSAQLAARCCPDVWGTQEDRGVSSLGGFPGGQPFSLRARQAQAMAGLRVTAFILPEARKFLKTKDV